MPDIDKESRLRRMGQNQQQSIQEHNGQFSAKKGAGYGAFGGFIAAVSFTGIMLFMPVIFDFPVGTFLHSLGTSILGVTSDPVNSGLAAFSIILIQGIVVGVIFGVVTSKVKALHPSNKRKGIVFGLVTGIIAFLVLYLPVMLTVYPHLLVRTFATYPISELSTRGLQDHHSIISSSYPLYLPGILGLGFFAYLVYGFFMGGIVTLAYSVYSFDLTKMEEKAKENQQEEKAKDKKTEDDDRQAREKKRKVG